MSLDGRLESLLQLEDSPKKRDILELSAVLLCCLFVLAPSAAFFFKQNVASLPEKEFVAIGAGGVVFGAYAIATKRLLSSIVAALFVLMTIRVNIPLGPASSLLGGIGPNFWLLHIPLISTTAYLLYRERRPPLSLPHILFFAFVGWSALTIIFGRGPRPDMAFWFTLWVFQAGLVFLVAGWLINSRIVSFETSLAVLSLTAVFHCLWGVLQFTNGSSFGLGHFGESSRSAVGSISFGPLGTHAIGPFVSGFAYGGAVAVLITLLFPIVVAFAVQSKGGKKLFYTVSALLLLFVQRVTGWDAARGAILVAAVVFLFGYIKLNREYMYKLTIDKSTLVLSIANSILATGIILWPSSESGSTSTYEGSPPQINSNTSTVKQPSGGDSDTSEITGDGTPGSSSTTDATSDTVGGEYLTSVEDLSIPLFDLSNLGIRIQQYVVAVDIAVQFPLFGLGGANFYYISNQIGFHTNYFMHSMYFQVLVETGFPGLLLYLGAITGGLYSGLKTLQGRSVNPILTLGAVAGVVGAAAHLSLNPQMTRLAAFMPFWAVLGLLVGQFQRQVDTAYQPGQR